MKITANNIDNFVNNPPASTRAALIYGPDEGLVATRANIIVKKIIDDIDDPFRIVTFDYDDIKKDQTRFNDELHAMCLTGGRRLIKIRCSGQAIAKEISEAITESKSDSFVLFTAGDLPPASGLRKFFEKENNIAALPCYKDDEATIMRVASDKVRQEGYSADNEAIRLLSNMFLGNRLIILNEIEKLIIYKGDNKHITVQDVKLCVEDNKEASLDNLCSAAASRNLATIDDNLKKALLDGTQPITIIRSLGRYFTRLLTAKTKIANGSTEQAALASLKPPVFFKQVPIFKKHLGMWNEKSLRKVLIALNDLEIECKRTGSPAELLCARFLAILPLAGR